MKFGAIVLAAGASSRMGQPKALLKIGDATFLQHIFDALSLAGIYEIVIVLGAKAEDIRRHLNWFEGDLVENCNWQDGQLSSILTGLDKILQKNIDGVFICPVDRPFFTRYIITDMMGLFSSENKHIIVPTFNERRGHPLLIGSSMFDELKKVSSKIGARQLLWNHPEEVLEYPTDYEGILLNIDTPDDYPFNVESHHYYSCKD